MKNISNKQLTLFFSIPTVTILSILLILFFVGNGEYISSITMIKMMYVESEDSHIIISLTIIMLLLIAITTTLAAGKINTKKSKQALLVTSVIILLSFITLRFDLLSISILPALYYSYQNIKMHNKTLQPDR